MEIYEAVERFLNDRRSRCSARTVEWYAYMLLQVKSHFGQKSVAAVTADDLRLFLAHYRGGEPAAATLAGMVRAVKSFFRWATVEGLIPADPSAALKAPRYERKPKALTEQQVRDLLALNLTSRDRALILFMLDSGARRGEVCALEIADVNLCEGFADIQHGKGDKARRVGLGRRTIAALRSHIGKRRAGRVFELEASGVREALRRLSKRLGFHLSPHMLRHTFATLAAVNGMDPAHLQDLLGHADVGTTKIYYASARQRAALAAHKRHGPIDNL